jgi:hypothetical protein
MIPDETYAKLGYEEYAVSTGGKTYDGPSVGCAVLKRYGKHVTCKACAKKRGLPRVTDGEGT